MEVFFGLIVWNSTSLNCAIIYYYIHEGTYQLNTLTVGQTYFVRIHTDNNLAYTDFNICVGTPPTPSTNDECDGAIALTVNNDLSCDHIISGTTIGASQSLEGCDGIADDDIWYKFVATSTRHQLQLSGVTESTVFEVFSGTCTALTSLQCGISVLLSK